MNKYGSETSRIEFLIERDGIEEARRFAHTSMVSYRRHLLKKCPREMRRSYIESYLSFKYFINRKKVDF